MLSSAVLLAYGFMVLGRPVDISYPDTVSPLFGPNVPPNTFNSVLNINDPPNIVSSLPGPNPSPDTVSSFLNSKETSPDVKDTANLSPFLPNSFLSTPKEVASLNPDLKTDQFGSIGPTTSPFSQQTSVDTSTIGSSDSVVPVTVPGLQVATGPTTFDSVYNAVIPDTNKLLGDGIPVGQPISDTYGDNLISTTPSNTDYTVPGAFRNDLLNMYKQVSRYCIYELSQPKEEKLVLKICAKDGNFGKTYLDSGPGFAFYYYPQQYNRAFWFKNLQHPCRMKQAGSWVLKQDCVPQDEQNILTDIIIQTGFDNLVYQVFSLPPIYVDADTTPKQVGQQLKIPDLQ